MIIADTSGLLTVYDRDQRDHVAVRRIVEQSDTPLVITQFVLAETDYLIAARLGIQVQHAFLEDLERGVFKIARLDERDVAKAAAVAREYADLRIGLTDASVVVAAALERTLDILTFDQRHFRVVRPTTSGEAFRLLPHDR